MPISSSIEQTAVYHRRDQRGASTVPLRLQHPGGGEGLQPRVGRRRILPDRGVSGLGVFASHATRPGVLAIAGRIHPGALARGAGRSSLPDQGGMAAVRVRAPELYRARVGIAGNESGDGDGAARIRHPERVRRVGPAPSSRRPQGRRRGTRIPHG